MKVLIVGEVHPVQAIEGKLHRLGHEVVVASNCREALQQFEAEKPDLIVMDAAGFRDGKQVLLDLKANPETAAIPVFRTFEEAWLPPPWYPRTQH